MAKLISLNTIKYWCTNILPLVYEDSLSYYELLSKLVYYVNSTITNVEALNNDLVEFVDTVDELIASQDQKIQDIYNYVNGYLRGYGVDYITPQMCGAKGDGVTDDTYALKLALEGNIKDVYIPEGNYIVNDIITIPDRKNIWGHGVIISTINNSDSTHLKEYYNVGIINATKVNLNGICVVDRSPATNRGYTFGGIVCVNSADVTIRNCRVSDSKSISAITLNNSNNVLVENCLVNSFQISGIICYGTNRVINILNNRIINDLTGLPLEINYGISLGTHRGETDGYNYCGYDITCDNNYIEYRQATWTGIDCHNGQKLKITNNQIIGVLNGINTQLDYRGETQISDNIIIDNNYIELGLTPTANFSSTDQFRYNHGIAALSKDVIITNNIIKNAGCLAALVRNTTSGTRGESIVTLAYNSVISNNKCYNMYGAMRITYYDKYGGGYFNQQNTTIHGNEFNGIKAYSDQVNLPVFNFIYPPDSSFDLVDNISICDNIIDMDNVPSIDTNILRVTLSGNTFAVKKKYMFFERNRFTNTSNMVFSNSYFTIDSCENSTIDSMISVNRCCPIYGYKITGSDGMAFCNRTATNNLRSTFDLYKSNTIAQIPVNLSTGITLSGGRLYKQNNLICGSLAIINENGFNNNDLLFTLPYNTDYISQFLAATNQKYCGRIRVDRDGNVTFIKSNEVTEAVTYLAFDISLFTSE